MSLSIYCRTHTYYSSLVVAKHGPIEYIYMYIHRQRGAQWYFFLYWPQLLIELDDFGIDLQKNLRLSHSQIFGTKLIVTLHLYQSILIVS